MANDTPPEDTVERREPDARADLFFDPESEAEQSIDPRLIDRVSIVVLILALSAGVLLRTIALDQAPPGLNQDEACNGYDALSLLTTGRDHHGNPLPIAIQGFNDYRMPLFDYSLVPMVAVRGLRVETVRLGAALWGSADLVMLAIIAGLIAGVRGSAAAVIIAAISPWHLPLSRFGHEAITASATVSAAMACVFAFARWRDGDWLILAAIAFAVSLYSYSVVKLFAPLMLIFLWIIYIRELRSARPQIAIGLAILAIAAIPEAWLLLQHGPEVQARFAQVSIASAGGSGLTILSHFARGFGRHFSPDFLFIRGQRFPIVHPPGFGQLLFAQGIMMATALAALREPKYRKPVMVLLGWLLIAAIPPALTLPSPHALRDVLAIAPWTVLSAVGLAYLLELPLGTPALRIAGAALILIGLLAEGGEMLIYYFRDYPAAAAREFQYGMDRVVAESERLSGGREMIVIPDVVNQPYIYVLFYDQYPPEQFQHDRVDQSTGLFATVRGFDRYRFGDPHSEYNKLRHGVFVFPGDVAAPKPASVMVPYPDGTIAFRIIEK